MRPTLLDFRSPKERTPGPNMPLVTCKGHSLRLASSKQPNIPNEKRFLHYKRDASKTGFLVGPGSYRDDERSISRKRFRGGPVYKRYHKNKPVQNNGYIYVGNQLVHDPEMEP